MTRDQIRDAINKACASATRVRIGNKDQAGEILSVLDRAGLEAVPKLRKARRMNAGMNAALAFLETFISQNGRAPKIREAMIPLGYASPGSVSKVFANLEKRGYIARSRSGIEVLRHEHQP